MVGAVGSFTESINCQSAAVESHDIIRVNGGTAVFIVEIEVAGHGHIGGVLDGEITAATRAAAEVQG